jgi:hypothetical protein
VNPLIVLLLWLGLCGGAWYLLGPIWGCVYLLLGLLCDRLCEKQAKKKGEKYSGAVQLCAYVFGPVIVPVALVFAFGKAAINMVRRH